MASRRVTFVLGAGASCAYNKVPYPALSNLLQSIVQRADARDEDAAPKQRLYLAYALSTAYGLDSPDLSCGRVPNSLIEQVLTSIKPIAYENDSLLTAFRRLESRDDRSGTRAYWALAYSIAVYMTLMARRDLRLPTHSTSRRSAHRSLVELFDELTETRVVDVVDMNYDGVLEHVRYERGSNVEFAWDCGRTRHVFNDSPEPLSRLADRRCFQPALDDGAYCRSVRLIKPHGDRCTFLRGSNEVYYSNGRHSHAHRATFPPVLRDIRTDDRFVRSSILPPTHSRHRHGSQFYEEEKERFVRAVCNGDDLVIVGWSASGSDTFYIDLFREESRDHSNKPRLHIIDRSDGGAPNLELEERLQKLCPGSTVASRSMHGFTEAAVEALRRALL